MSAAIQPRGTWIRWTSLHRNNTNWHWLHSTDSTTYCGQPKPPNPKSTESMWNPLSPCKKCIDRINREGY